MNLLLIGLRGSGKTTVGRMLAERFRLPFVDLDALTTKHLGCATTAEAFTKFGEVRFRDAEAMALATALSRGGQVVALGGGTPTASGATAMLRSQRDAGQLKIVYLAAASGTLRDRLEKTDMSQRPSLTGVDPLAEIEAVMNRRDGLYRELAEAVVETDSLTPEQTAEAVVGELGL
ncbi:MAG: shikimate kinase [Phycisphaerales bacterium]